MFGEVSTVEELDGRPVCGVLGDSHAALYAYGPSARGVVKATYGTGTSVMSLLTADSPTPAFTSSLRSPSSNDLLMQFQADLCGVPVVRPASVESSALGAVQLAAAAAGLPWQAGSAQAPADRFEPRLRDDDRADLMGRWHEAVAAALASAHQRPGGLQVGDQHVNPLP